MKPLNRLSIAKRRHGRALALLAAAFLAGCAHVPKPAPDTPDVTSLPNTLAPLPAQYAGTLPCGGNGCKGIAFWLTIGAGHNYVLQQHYDTRDSQGAADYVEIGQWKMEQAGQRLLLTPADSDESATSFWSITAAGDIVALDQNARPIEPVADYTLKRRAAVHDEPFANTRWYLVNAPDANSGGTAYIRFDGEHRLVGNSGCNSLAGTYHRDGHALTLDHLGSGDSDCLEAEDTQQSMLEALRQTRRARVIGNYLLLFGAAGDQSPVAVFQAKTPYMPLSL